MGAQMIALEVALKIAMFVESWTSFPSSQRPEKRSLKNKKPPGSMPGVFIFKSAYNARPKENEDIQDTPSFLRTTLEVCGAELLHI